MTRRERGFTLIEVVVAFAMLALVFAVGLEIFSTGISRAVDLELDSQALAIAQSRIAAAGIEELPKEGEARGESEDHRFRWTTVTAKSDEGQDPAKPLQGPFILYRVDTRVEWRTDSGRDRDLTLSTMVLGPRT